MKTTSCYRRLHYAGAIGKPQSPAEILPHQPLRPIRISLRSSSSFSSSSSSFRLMIRKPKKKGSSPLEVGPRGGAGACWYSIGGDREAEEKVDKRVEVAAAAAATVVLGVGNRVLYKLALVPLKHYPFFLAQLSTFGYVIVYFTILYVRYHAGIVTYEMLSMPKAPFLLVGLLEALGAATGMAAAAMLSGASIPILSQTFLVWQILLSTIFLGRRYKANQLLGCLLVTIGVIITVASGSTPGHSLKEAGIFWTLLMIFSFFLQAADTVVKETIFLDSCQQLKVHKYIGSSCCMQKCVALEWP